MLRKIILATTLFLTTQTAAHAADDRQILCLAENMYHEARGEGDRGMIAVGNVVMNRARSGRFPNNPCAVIRQRTGRTCQFSWVCSGRRLARESVLYNRALRLSRAVYLNEVSDITNGALFFHSRSVRPYWAKSTRRTAMIGSHSFYRG